MRWPAQVPGGRRITDFVLLTDIAPTFLAAAGLSIPDEMTGHSLLPTLQSNQRGRVDAMRDHVIIGRERHVPSQELPDLGGYPMRALRTDDYLFIRNYRPDRWPAGTPYYEKANGTWLGDCDNGPTKTYLWTHRDEESVREKYALCFAKRPGEELYDLKNDPNQLHNVADNAAFADIKNQLARRLQSELVAAEDPRALGQGDEFFDQHEYLGGGPKWPFQKD